MQQWEALKEKTNEELFSLYQEDRRTEIKQELTLRYLYIVKPLRFRHITFIPASCRWKTSSMRA